MPPFSRLAASALGVVLLAGACTAAETPRADDDVRRSASPSPPPTISQPLVPSSPPATTPAAVAFDRDAALETVRRLAEDIGPREATSPNFAQAADLVVATLRDRGYDVRRDGFRVPGGVSWGVPVRAGRSLNVVATPTGFQPDQPHVVVGAHLDTVPQAPGAEDNASGVAVLLELARLAAAEPPGLPAVLIAFGAEEPRGSGDALHHFGSQHYVREMSAVQRRALVAMVSLDRVGTGRRVPVCTGGLSPLRVQRQLLQDAAELDIPARRCAGNRASDHWSFEKAGAVVARIGSTPYAAYHSPRDRVGVVRPVQLDRVGRLMWRWLTTGRGGTP